MDNKLKVSDLLSIPSRWCKGADARVSHLGEVTDASDPRATCFCLGGGLQRCYPDKPALEFARKKVRAAILLRTGKEQSESEFNDASGTKHEDVLAVAQAAGV